MFLKLVTTATCPKCKQVEKILNEKGFIFKKVLAENEPELVKEFNIRTAPTLVVGETKFVDLSEIYNFVQNQDNAIKYTKTQGGISNA